jgi:hypothetical protein
MKVCAPGITRIAAADGSVELYDLARDPQEQRNVVAAMPVRPGLSILRLKSVHPTCDACAHE